MGYDFLVSVGPTGHLVYVNRDEIATYAYLVDAREKIVGDVWLCNTGDTPSQYPWRAGGYPPFANPSDFAKEWEGVGEFIETPSLLSAKWISQDPVRVELYYDGHLIARLGDGEKPGTSILAKRDGPLAKRMSAGTACDDANAEE